MTSVGPAGAKGTTIFTGLSGYPAAETGKTPSASVHSAPQIASFALEYMSLLPFFVIVALRGDVASGTCIGRGHRLYSGSQCRPPFVRGNSMPARKITRQ